MKTVMNYRGYIIKQVNEWDIKQGVPEYKIGEFCVFNKDNDVEYDSIDNIEEAKEKIDGLVDDKKRITSRLAKNVNLNNEVHKGMNKSWMKELPFSSFHEYVDIKYGGICKKDIILGQFKSVSDFSKYCFGVLPIIQKRKEDIKEFNKICID